MTHQESNVNLEDLLK